jgi:hypothetical protein
MPFHSGQRIAFLNLRRRHEADSVAGRHRELGTLIVWGPGEESVTTERPAQHPDELRSEKRNRAPRRDPIRDRLPQRCLTTIVRQCWHA